jgi:hypothetical protein
LAFFFARILAFLRLSWAYSTRLVGAIARVTNVADALRVIGGIKIAQIAGRKTCRQ